MIVFSLTIFLLTLIALADVIAKLKPVPLIGALVMAFPAFIALETIILNLLSIFEAISRPSLIAVHLGLLFAWLSWLVTLRREWSTCVWVPYRTLISRCFKPSAYHFLVPLVILLALAAWIYPPNTYDSLTYHMARVAHWIQAGSVAYFPTPIDRQNVMGPGAEYVILFFQVLTGSDYLAGFPQVISFLLLIAGLTYLIRLLKIPSGWAPYIVILTLTMPMAMMQASGTKNDLVAALMTIALLVSCRRVFLGQISRMTRGEYAVIGICIAAAYLVKPTSVIVCAPLLFGGALYQLFILKNKRDLSAIFIGAGIVLLVMTSVIGPDVNRKIENNVSRHEVYPLFSGYDADRFWNPLRGLAQNIPFPDYTRQLLQGVGYEGELRTSNVMHFAEDMVGNPYQALTVVFLSLATFCLFPFVWRLEYRAPFLLSCSPVAAWIIFGLIIRDQPWLTRLQLPLLILLPFSFAFLGRIAVSRKWLNTAVRLAIALLSMVSLAYGGLTAAHVPPRSLALSHFWGERVSRTAAYYNNVDLRSKHDLLIKTARKNQCSRIGLILGPDSVEYPLTWRAMNVGMETRHLWNSSQDKGDRHNRRIDFIEEERDWPCILYVAHGSREAVPNVGEQWISVEGDYHTHLRNPEWEFRNASQTCITLAEDSLVGVISNTQNMDVASAGQGIAITALTEDPSFQIPPVSCGEAQSAIIRIDIHSTVDTNLKVYYRTGEKKAFNETNSKTAPIQPGNNHVYLFLPINEIIGSLRIDPGAAPGQYEIKSIEIRSVSRSIRADEPSNRTFHTRVQ